MQNELIEELVNEPRTGIGTRVYNALIRRHHDIKSIDELIDRVEQNIGLRNFGEESYKWLRTKLIVAGYSHVQNWPQTKIQMWRLQQQGWDTWRKPMDSTSKIALKQELSGLSMLEMFEICRTALLKSDTGKLVTAKAEEQVGSYWCKDDEGNYPAGPKDMHILYAVIRLLIEHFPRETKLELIENYFPDHQLCRRCDKLFEGDSSFCYHCCCALASIGQW